MFISINYLYICDVQLLNTFIDILTYTTETAPATLRRAPVPIILNPRGAHELMLLLLRVIHQHGMAARRLKLWYHSIA